MLIRTHKHKRTHTRTCIHFMVHQKQEGDPYAGLNEEEAALKRMEDLAEVLGTGSEPKRMRERGRERERERERDRQTDRQL